MPLPHNAPTETTRVIRVSYDALRCAFRGRVDVERAGRTFRYPCEIAAPADADPAWVNRAMTARALAMSDSGPH